MVCCCCCDIVTKTEKRTEVHVERFIGTKNRERDQRKARITWVGKATNQRASCAHVRQRMALIGREKHVCGCWLGEVGHVTVYWNPAGRPSILIVYTSRPGNPEIWNIIKFIRLTITFQILLARGTTDLCGHVTSKMIYDWLTSGSLLVHWTMIPASKAEWSFRGD